MQRIIRTKIEEALIIRFSAKTMGIDEHGEDAYSGEAEKPYLNNLNHSITIL